MLEISLRQRTRIGAGGRVLHGGDRDSLGVLLAHAEFGERRGNAKRLAQFEDPRQHRRESLTGKRQDAGDMIHLGFDRVSVANHDIGKHDAVRQAVVGVVKRPNGMRNGMDRAKPFLKGGRAHR